ncbi:MAG: xanthine dehydrogenase family protein molybdopterin-binding subunit, partial [Dehalococcoidia bacterium]
MATGRHKVIGQRLPKVDGIEKVTGKSQFGADVYLTGTLYAQVLRSPYAHARIKGIDYSRALEHPGVKAVVTGADFPEVQPGTFAPMGEMDIDMYHLTRLVMARDKALFHGHPVAAVAATSLEAAREALQLIQVEYDSLPLVLDPVEAMQPEAPLLHEDLYTRSMAGKAERPSNVGLHLEMDRGDMEAGFAEADVVIERQYRTQMVHQGYIEPEAEMALVYPDGKVVVWADTQGAF